MLFAKGNSSLWQREVRRDFKVKKGDYLSLDLGAGSGLNTAIEDY